MKKKRQTLGLSQAKLAEKVNTAPTYIAMIELEKKFPSVEMLERIAGALAMDTTELFSVKPLPEDSLKTLHRSVLLDFEGIIARRLEELRDEPPATRSGLSPNLL
jgi:transcriptional regulator with XRE-family HTH domain